MRPEPARRLPAAASIWRPLCLVLSCCLIVGCATQRVAPYDRPPPDYAMAPVDDDAFAELAADIQTQHGEDYSGFKILDSNEDGLQWRLILIDSARHSIDAQYYLWYADAAGRLLLSRLLQAADRGVKVRLLVDDLNTLISDATTVSLRDSIAARINAHPNIELRLFNPWSNRDIASRLGESVSEIQRVNQRMHNKSLIVDNRALIMGGRNIGDEYMGLNPDFNFRDLDLLAIGPAAQQASAVFDQYWNSHWVLPVAALDLAITAEEQRAGRTRLESLLGQEEALTDFPLAPGDWQDRIAALADELHAGTSEMVSDRPENDGMAHDMLDRIRTMMSAAQRELLIENAYIIPAETSMDILRQLGERGVTVKIMTNSLASHDVPAVNSHYKRWRRPILETGAELFEMRHDAEFAAPLCETGPVVGDFVGLHAKAMVVDREQVYVGSMNFDPRSAGINTEMGIFIDSPTLGEALAQIIERDMEPGNSWRVSLDENGKLFWHHDTRRETRQPARNWWQRVEDVIFMAFPKELY